MPFKVALAKLAPKILPAVAKAIPKVASVAQQVAPKLLPQVRTVASLVGKAQGIAGAVSGGASLPQVMAAAAPYDYRSTYEIEEAARRASRGTMYPTGPMPGGAAVGIPRMAGRATGRPAAKAAPKAPPGGGGQAPTVRAGGVMATGMMDRKTLTGLFDRAGRWFSDRRVAALARRVGLELAATGLGVAVGLVATSIARDATRSVRRRRRGISWGQLNTTRKTLRKFESMNRYLCRPTAPKRRAAACR